MRRTSAPSTMKTEAASVGGQNGDPNIVPITHSGGGCMKNHGTRCLHVQRKRGVGMGGGGPQMTILRRETGVGGSLQTTRVVLCGGTGIHVMRIISAGRQSSDQRTVERIQ